MAIIKNTNDSKCGGMETPYKCVLGGCINEFTVIFLYFLSHMHSLPVRQGFTLRPTKLPYQNPPLKFCLPLFCTQYMRGCNLGLADV